MSRYKKDFPIFQNTKFYSKDLVYLDNSATTQKPQVVINEFSQFYENSNANIYRGVYRLSEEATSLYEKSRKDVADFIGAKENEIVFTKNTTESINLIVLSFARSILKKGDLVLLSIVEHHSNIVPWLILQKEIGFKIKYIDIDDTSFEFSNIDLLLSENPKIVSITHVSNVTGIENNIKEIANKAHRNGAIIIVDGAQSIPHKKIDVVDLDCDFFVFSAHKMLGPTGVGVLFGKQKFLDEMQPIFGGGEMILSVEQNNCSFKSTPYKFEAGTINFADTIVFSKSLEYISNIGISKIEKYIKDLSLYTYKRLQEVDGIKIYGLENTSGIYSFSIKKIHPHDIASFLDEDNIAIRAGHHCAQVLMERFEVYALCRVSIYIYNDKSDIDKLVDSLSKISRLF
jgi:cysteine desulfurase/selenocysteine lyase